MRHWIATLISCCYLVAQGQTHFRHDLHQSTLAVRWDEALPLGNGMVGALLWKKGDHVRFSLDRADLWDQRPMADIDQLTFDKVKDHVARHDYGVIQALGDVPYEREAAPSKIPGAALEFDTSDLGAETDVHLHIKEGMAIVRWAGGKSLTTFVHPTLSSGWFRWEGAAPLPQLVPPQYGGENKGTGNSVEGQGLARLGYPQGTITKTEAMQSYHQEGWNGFSYDVVVTWKKTPQGLEGVWAITSSQPYHPTQPAAVLAAAQLKSGFLHELNETRAWWNDFWSASTLSVPDPVIERQWYLDNYKFGCTARSYAPPITLQAIWTADNGNLPPWKGDIHNDLNTQLSYWPAYSANHLEAARGFTRWLWNQKPVFEAYTQRFFNTPGLAVPGVTTLNGNDMGGWVQYSYSPTVAGWLSHHFYLEWQFTRDSIFLQQRALPWIRSVAQFFKSLAVRNAQGQWQLPLSSSPEFFDNSERAWFTTTTNYDLAIIRWNLEKVIELETVAGHSDAATSWREFLNQWPALSLDAAGALALAPGLPYPESHRHFSHLMGFHPLGLLNYNLPSDRSVIDASMKGLEDKGSQLWVGYSFAWQAGMYARMGRGDRAADVLRKFSTCFCLPNSFHVNGDQCEGKLSSFRYRPFTLEGNFAAAAATQELLLQSHAGVIRLFPAIPSDWRRAGFETMRVQGAFVISASLEEKKILARIHSEKGGELVLEDRFARVSAGKVRMERRNHQLIIQTQPGQDIVLTATLP